MPQAARVTDLHVCPHSPATGLPILPPCVVDVLIGGLPAARLGDLCICLGPGMDPIKMGSSTVMIAKAPAARRGDPTGHGGRITTGLQTVLIGGEPIGDACDQPGSFAEKFECITGMELSDSITLYEAETGETLTPETVERMFKDPAFANERLMESKSLHTIYRSILNSNIPATEADAVAQGYEKLSTIKSLYHNPWYDPWQNSKYVSGDGHREAVFDGQGNLVDSIDYKGTFNFFGPDQATSHWKADVEPYREWGN